MLIVITTEIILLMGTITIFLAIVGYIIGYEIGYGKGRDTTLLLQKKGWVDKYGKVKEANFLQEEENGN